MHEPQNSAVAVLVAMASAFFGAYSVIIFAALAGALWPLSGAKTATRKDGALLLLRLVCTAAALTGFVAWSVERHFGLPSSEAMAPVAFVIAAVGDRWRDIFDSIVERVRSIVSGGR